MAARIFVLILVAVCCMFIEQGYCYKAKHGGYQKDDEEDSSGLSVTAIVCIVVGCLSLFYCARGIIKAILE